MTSGQALILHGLSCVQSSSGTRGQKLACLLAQAAVAGQDRAGQQSERAQPPPGRGEAARGHTRVLIGGQTLAISPVIKQDLISIHVASAGAPGAFLQTEQGGNRHRSNKKVGLTWVENGVSWWVKDLGTGGRGGRHGWAARVGAGRVLTQPAAPGPAWEISAPEEAETGFDLVSWPGTDPLCSDPLCSCDRAGFGHIFDFVRCDAAFIDALLTQTSSCVSKQYQVIRKTQTQPTLY